VRVRPPTYRKDVKLTPRISTLVLVLVPKDELIDVILHGGVDHGTTETTYN
jgi:hypothetical protein